MRIGKYTSQTQVRFTQEEWEKLGTPERIFAETVKTDEGEHLFFYPSNRAGGHKASRTGNNGARMIVVRATLIPEQYGCFASMEVPLTWGRHPEAQSVQGFISLPLKEALKDRAPVSPSKSAAAKKRYDRKTVYQPSVSAPKPTPQGVDMSLVTKVSEHVSALNQLRAQATGGITFWTSGEKLRASVKVKV